MHAQNHRTNPANAVAMHASLENVEMLSTKGIRRLDAKAPSDRPGGKPRNLECDDRDIVTPVSPGSLLTDGACLPHCHPRALRVEPGRNVHRC